MKTAAWLVNVLATAMIAGSASANLIVNGSFEEGNYAGGPWNSVPPGDNRVTAWEAVEKGFDWHNQEHFGPAYDGSMMIDLTYGFAYGGISQTFATVAGQQYWLRFALAGPENGGSFQNPRAVNVSVAGLNQTFDAPASPASGLTWDVENFIFQATASQTTLTFRGNNLDQYWGPVIDAVSVTAVPEPSTYLAGLSALAVLSLVARRRG